MYYNLQEKQMVLEDFNKTIDIWITELDKYTIHQLVSKPLKGWSLGQLYMHLVNDSQFYIEQINICLLENENSNEESSDFARMLFSNGSFPDEDIAGDPSNSFIKQPDSKEQLQDFLISLRTEFNKLYKPITQSTFKGKTKHPGLNYFNAIEWFLFAEMHFRHHLRQKKKIDLLLVKDKIL